MECVMTNMLEPGKTVLIANNGIWGIRSADMARRQGATVKEIVTAAGTNFSLAQLTAGVKEHKPDLLFVTHGESSTGVVQPLAGVGAMCHQNNCLLAVDTVASLGGVPVMADQLEIDVIYTGSQKVLGVPPGTAPISFSPRAVQRFKERTKPPCSFYLDLGWLGEYWNCWPDKGRVYHHTGPVNAMYALREGLAAVSSEGLENCWRRHKLSADQLHTGLAQLGLDLFVQDPNYRLPTVTTIKVPEGVNWQAVAGHCMKNHLVEISEGLEDWSDGKQRKHQNCTEGSGCLQRGFGDTRMESLRKFNANIRTVQKVLDAFREALETQGWK